MKNICAFLLFFASIHCLLAARIGCRDDSWHLQKKYDYKQDHAVACLCPCPEKMDRCARCTHYHEAQPWTIVTNFSKKELKGKKNDRFFDPRLILKKLVIRR